MTIDMLKKFGVDIENDNYKSFYIKGNQRYKSRNYRVEGDFSQAAFWLVSWHFKWRYSMRGFKF